MPRIKSSPEDFVVSERLLYDLAGAGPHLFLYLEKRNSTTDELIRQIAREIGLSPDQVGHAGRKDKHAITRQWISIPASDHVESRIGSTLGSAKVLECHRHRDRLRRGQLAGNRFRVVVREVSSSLLLEAQQRASEIARRGFANYFGPQRFGGDGRNGQRGRAILSSGRFRGPRSMARLMLSAFQSEVFNRVLDQRRQLSSALAPVVGDLVISQSSGRLVAVTAENLAKMTWSPSGPLPGSKMRKPTGLAAEIETQALAHFEVDQEEFERLPRSIRQYGDRRALRVRPAGLKVTGEQSIAEVEVELPAGCYVTVLLEQLFGELEVGSNPSASEQV